MESLRRLARRLVPAAPVAAVVAVVFGMTGLVVGMSVRIGDPQVQAGIVGATAGIVGGLIGSSVGAWSAGRVADRTLADAQAARVESREDAQRVRFLDERRSAVVDVLLAGDRAMAIAIDRGRRGPTALQEPLPAPDGPGIDRAFRVMTLLAPDLAIGTGRAYRNAVKDAVYSCMHWAGDAGPREGEPGKPGDMPDSVQKALADLSDAESNFTADAVFHLGVIDYAEDRLAEIMAKNAAQSKPTHRGGAEVGE